MFRFLKILSILSIAAIVLLSLFTWYSCDDFCNRIELARYTVFKMAWLQYMNWDGRSLSISSFVQLISLKYFPVELTTFIWASCFVISAIFIFKILQIENPFFYKGKNSFILVSVLSAMMWLGLWKLIPDIIYWPTGGSYSLLNLLGVAWLYIFLRGLKNEKFNGRNYVFIFFLSFFLGNNSHNFILGLITICLAELGYYRVIKKDNRASRYIISALAGLCISACIVFLAPGNQVRLHSGTHIGMNWNFIINYLVVIARYAYWLAGLLILCLVVLRLCGQKILFDVKAIQNEFRKKQSFFILFYNHKYLVAAFATIAVFFSTAYFAVPRTAVFFSVFLVIYLFQKGWKKELDMHSKTFIYGSTIFLCLFTGILVFQMIQAYSVKQKLNERETVFKSMEGNDAIVPSIPGKDIPFAFSFVDISSDSAYWVNRCVALHYGLKTVRVNPD